MRPRRLRKVRTDSLKENQNEISCENEKVDKSSEVIAKEPTSPMLPWKKNNALSLPSLVSFEMGNYRSCQ